MSSTEWVARITLKNAAQNASSLTFAFARVTSGNLGFPVVGEPTIEVLSSRGVPGVRHRNTGNRVEPVVMFCQEPVTTSSGQSAEAYQGQMNRYKQMKGQVARLDFKLPGDSKTSVFEDVYIQDVMGVRLLGRMIGFGATSAVRSIGLDVTLDLSGTLRRQLIAATQNNVGG